MLRIVVALALLSFCSAFVGFNRARNVVQSTTTLFGDVFQNWEDCPQKLKDKNGRCPGHTGFIPSVWKEDPKSNFATFQAAQKLKKQQAAEAAAKAASEKK